MDALEEDDFELYYVDVQDGAQGPVVGVFPFTVGNVLPFRRQNPAWVTRYRPVLDRINGLIEHDPEIRMHADNVRGAVRSVLKDHPTFNSADLHNFTKNGRMPVAEAVLDASYALGKAVHKSDPYLSYLKLWVMINNPAVGLQDYDDQIERAAQKRELRRESYKVRRTSVGEEMKIDAELPFGTRDEIERQTREREKTLLERTQEAQRLIPEYPRGQQWPAGTQPRPRLLDGSDDKTIAHYGFGSGMPSSARAATRVTREKVIPLRQHVNPFSDIKSYRKLAGCGMEDLEPAENASPADPIEYAYTDADISAALGSVPIHKYPELKAMSSPDALFKGNKAAVLLFLTEGRNSGHWICVLDHDSHYEVFDSFGVAIDGNRKWLDERRLMEFGQTLPLLSILLQKGNKPVNHNTSKLQANDANTCGRWVVWRILNAATPLDAFVSEMKSGSGTPDQTVTERTYGILDK